MARQFKASTFFNKLYPDYYVQYTTDGDQKYHYSYEFNDGTVDKSVIDFCESRMLISIYALLSIYENKIIIPSGKVVDLADFQKTSLYFLKNVSNEYFSSVERFTENSKDLTHFKSTNLDNTITHDEFSITNFYTDNLFKNEIIHKASVIAYYFDKYPSLNVNFILNFQLDVAEQFKSLAKQFDILKERTLQTDVEVDSFSDDDNNEFNDDFSNHSYFSDDGLNIPSEKIINCEKNISLSLSLPSYRNIRKPLTNHDQFMNKNIINFEMLRRFTVYSKETIQDPHRLALFKMLDQADKKMRGLKIFFAKELASLSNKSDHELIKESKIKSFTEHFELYSESKKIRPDILSKMNRHYDLVDGVEIFSNYPYSSRQYENQAYMPFMIKAPVKKATACMVDEIEKMVDDYPHFYEVINYISMSLKINIKTNSMLGFKNILIVGSNGVGKNSFVKKLNDILGYVGNTVNMTSVLAPFELSGMDAGWNGSAPGFFFKSILKNNVANSIVILDDIDKVNNGHNGNVNTSIVDLLEPSNAKCYYENFFQTNLDMSHISIIGLANTVETIDRGVLNLFKVFTVEKPDVSSISSVTFSIYNELIKEPIYSFIQLTDQEANELVAKFIMSKVFSPRSIRKVIEDTLNEKLIETVKVTEPSLHSNDGHHEIDTQLLKKDK